MESKIDKLHRKYFFFHPYQKQFIVYSVLNKTLQPCTSTPGPPRLVLLKAVHLKSKAKSKLRQVMQDKLNDVEKWSCEKGESKGDFHYLGLI